jgi:hypothetical protein
MNVEQMDRQNLPTIQWDHEIRASNNNNVIQKITATGRSRIFGYQFAVKPRRWKYEYMEI